MDEVERLIQTLRDWSPGSRRQAAERLGNLGDVRAVGPLCQELENGHWFVRKRAAIALAKMGTPAVEPLCRLLREGNENVRVLAAWALGRIDDMQALRSLCCALKDKDWNVRKQAADALGNMGRREALPALRERLRPLLGESDSNALVAIRTAIQKIEKATIATKDLPRPATTPMPDTSTLPRPAGAPTFDVDKLPRPSNKEGE